MRHPFLKMFATFWLAQSLIFLASVGILALERAPGPISIADAFENHISHHAATALHVYETGGCIAFKHGDDHDATNHDELLDANMQPLCGEPSLGLTKSSFAKLHSRIVGEQINERVVWFVPLPTNNSPAVEFAWIQPVIKHSPHRYDDLEHYAYPWLFVSIVIGGLTTFVLVLLLRGRFLSLKNAARQLASGDLCARVNLSKSWAIQPLDDEFIELATDFNEMADRLESLVSAQRILLRDVSHELRSPLSRLSVALELAREHADSQTDLHFTRIGREAGRLNYLIGQLLTLSSLDSRVEPSSRDAVSISDICRMIVQDANYESQSRSCKVELIVEAEVLVTGDAALLHRAIENVVRNAIRYTDPMTSVTLKVSKDSAGVASVEISDCGPGVPENELINIFRPFYRLDDSRSQSTGGHGVGLAIAQRAIKLHGGDLKLSNRHGGGLTAIFSIPTVS